MTNRKKAKYENDFVYNVVLNDLYNTALERYRFTGLPESVNERVLKEALLLQGTACFFEYAGGVLCLGGMPSTDLNIYGEWKNYYIYGANGFNKTVELYMKGAEEVSFINEGINEVTTDENIKGVMIREKYDFSIPFIKTVELYAKRIADVMRGLDVVVNHSKYPYIITCPDNLVATVNTMLKKAKENNDQIVLSTGVFDADKIQIVPLANNSQGSIQTFMQLIEFYKNAFKEACGISNLTQNNFKKANLTTVETDNNEDYTQRQTDKVLECMQNDLNFVNKIFNLNIRVEKIQQEEDAHSFDTDNFGTEVKEVRDDL